MFLSGNVLASRKDYWFFPKNCALNIGTYFFLHKDIFIYHINLEELKKKNLVAFCCVLLRKKQKYPENLSPFVTLLS